MAGPPITPSTARACRCARHNPPRTFACRKSEAQLFTANRAKFLPQPRIAIAWSPFDDKTTIRAAFGMYNDLQDALGYRADQNAPFNPTYNIGATSLSNIFPGGNPIQRSAAAAGQLLCWCRAEFSPTCTLPRSSRTRSRSNGS